MPNTYRERACSTAVERPHLESIGLRAGLVTFTPRFGAQHQANVPKVQGVT